VAANVLQLATEPKRKPVLKGTETAEEKPAATEAEATQRAEIS
jgi:hypothetical protein